MTTTAVIDEPLVINLPSRLKALGETRIVLDPGTRRMIVERRDLFGWKDPNVWGFDDICQIDKRQWADETSTVHSLRLELHSGERHWIKVFDDVRSRQAVNDIRGYLGIDPKAKSTTDLARSNRARDLFWTLVLVVIVTWPLLCDAYDYLRPYLPF